MLPVFLHSDHNDVFIQVQRRKGHWWRTRPSRFQVGWTRERHRAHQCVAGSPMQSCGGLKGAGGYYTISRGSSGGRRWERPPLISSLNGILSAWAFESGATLSCNCLVPLFPDIYKSLLSLTAQFCQHSEPLMMFFSVGARKNCKWQSCTCRSLYFCTLNMFVVPNNITNVRSLFSSYC